jgi:hypothetical protein
MRRHWVTIHQPSTLGLPRYPTQRFTSVYVTESGEEEDVEELLDFLLDGDEGD